MYNLANVAVLAAEHSESDKTLWGTVFLVACVILVGWLVLRKKK